MPGGHRHVEPFVGRQSEACFAAGCRGGEVDRPRIRLIGAGHRKTIAGPPAARGHSARQGTATAPKHLEQMGRDRRYPSRIRLGFQPCAPFGVLRYE